VTGQAVDRGSATSNEDIFTTVVGERLVGEATVERIQLKARDVQ
jgi:hypothetical protein